MAVIAIDCACNDFLFMMTFMIGCCLESVTSYKQFSNKILSGKDSLVSSYESFKIDLMY